MLLFFATNVMFVVTWNINPGYLEQEKGITFLKLVEKLEPSTLCPQCEVVCTPESRHCFICNRCVEGFDHHCQWVNNCVGSR